ncbi:MAG TPA: twin-arginine translocation signal domain-containing protein, partial [Armatimonadota bacterium]|nr:twin-arginine translocation signal domain-containing protein [Armatimonadota bacterium]
MTRRTFLRGAAAAGGWAALGGALPMARAAERRARVALVRSARVLREGAIDAEVLGRMVDRAVMLATGGDSADRAWASLFSSDEVVGIKPNGLGG